MMPACPICGGRAKEGFVICYKCHVAGKSPPREEPGPESRIPAPAPCPQCRTHVPEQICSGCHPVAYRAAIDDAMSAIRGAWGAGMDIEEVRAFTALTARRVCGDVWSDATLRRYQPAVDPATARSRRQEWEHHQQATAWARRF